MDNLTHSLVGLAAAKVGLERRSPYATFVCVAAANLPDIDIVALAGGPAFYLKHHRGITHSIAGTLALAVAFVLFYCCAMKVVQTRARDEAELAARELAAQFDDRALRVAATPVLADPLTWRCLAENERSSVRFDKRLGRPLGEPARAPAASR